MADFRSKGYRIYYERNIKADKVTKVKANTLEELAEKLEGVDKDGFLKTIKEYNDLFVKISRLILILRMADVRKG